MASIELSVTLAANGYWYDRWREAMRRHERTMRAAKRSGRRRCSKLMKKAWAGLVRHARRDPGLERLAADVRAIIGETTGVRH